MKLIGDAFRSGKASALFRKSQLCRRTFSSFSNFGGSGGKERASSFESNDDFEQRIFGDTGRDDPRSNSFFNKLDRIGNEKSSFLSKFDFGGRSEHLDGLDGGFSTLSDGLDRKLKKAATYFEFDTDEVNAEDYAFRPDVSFRPGMTYEPKDLDLTKPGVRRPFKRQEFETTTEEVLKKADFRNVRFLANFLTEGGIIIKRSQTGISAKAQRKVAREIKTARAFGLLPFTTMGTKAFVYGKSMEDRDEDFEYDAYDDTPSFVDDSPVDR